MQITKILNLIILILLSSQVHAKQLRGFCFPKSTNLDYVRGALKRIELPQDRASFRFGENCVEAELDDGRNDLYKAYLASKFSVIRSYSGTPKTKDSMAAARNCRIQFITEMSEKKKTKVRRVGGKLQLKDLMGNKTNSKSSMILVSPGHSAFINVDNNKVGISCFPKSGNTVDLGVSLKSDQQGLKTRVSVIRGQKFNVGDVVEDLSSNSREVSLGKGYGRKKSKGAKVTKYFLIVQ